MRVYKNYIKTPKSITIMFSEGNPVNITDDNTVYTPIIDAIKEHNYVKVADLVESKMNILKYSTFGKFCLDENKNVVINDVKIPEAISNCIIKFVELGINTTPLELFWDNLNKNPSEESKLDLYGFLDKNHIPITEDGCFIAYKSINKDFKDFHTRTFDNGIGAVVSMEREKVNPNRNETCSSGLHVAAFEFASTFGDSDRIVVEVKINPQDVVSVPTDYNSQKMRVCKYKVVDIHNKHEGEIKEVLYGTEIKKEEPKEMPAITVKKSSKTQPKTMKLTKENNVFTLRQDGDGRVRIPSEALKRIGARKTVFVAIKNSRSRNVIIQTTPTNDDFYSNLYKLSEGSVKLSPIVFQKAKIAWAGSYTARVVGKTLEVRQSK